MFVFPRLNEESTTSNSKLKAVDKNTLPPKKKRKVDVKKYFVDETFSDFEEEAYSSENSEMQEDSETHKDSEILEDVENSERRKQDEQLIKDKHAADSNCDALTAENKSDIISSSDSNSKETLVPFKQNKSDCHDNKATLNIEHNSSSIEETSAKQNKSECFSNKNTIDTEHIPAVFVPLNRKPEIQVNILFSTFTL